jgi:hypothetical protein
MAFVPTPNMVQSTLFFEGSGGLFAQNRFFFATTGVPTLEAMGEIDDALYAVVVAQYCTHMSGFWQLNGITHRAMNEEEGLQLVSAQAYPQAGGIGESEQEAAQVTYTVTLSTGLVGRSARGRVYGVGLWNAATTGNRLATGTQATLQAAWTLIRTAMETAGHAMQVVSFQEGGVPRTEGRALPVLSTAVRFPLATQRRRLS